MSTTFDFGAGPVPAHQHPYGGGWVADTAFVADRVYVENDARVVGGTIHGGDIHGGTIRGGTIHGGTIRSGTIHGGTIRGGYILGGTIYGGTIHGGTIRGGYIWGGTIYGGTINGGYIRGGYIWGGTIRGGVISGGTIREDRDILILGPVGSEDQHITLVRDDDTHILTVGCWRGHTVDQLAAEVEVRCPDRAEEYAEIEAVLRRRLTEWGQQ